MRTPCIMTVLAILLAAVGCGHTSGDLPTAPQATGTPAASAAPAGESPAPAGSVEPGAEAPPSAAPAAAGTDAL